jgi:hypothetical protein
MFGKTQAGFGCIIFLRLIFLRLVALELEALGAGFAKLVNRFPIQRKDVYSAQNPLMDLL